MGEMKYNFPTADGNWMSVGEIMEKIWVKSNSVLFVLNTVLCIVGHS